MFDNPPKEREARSWGYVVLWSGIIFATIPFVRMAVSFVGDRWGVGAFTYGVAACIFVATTVALYTTRKQWSLSSVITLIVLAGAMIYLTFGLASGSPVEAMHYVQYGTLSFLLFRAFSHRIRDYSIYVSATIAGTFVGMIDETIQWITPGRFFDLRDIWLNLTAVAFVQIALAAGIRPKMIKGLPGWDSLRRLCYVSALALGYLGLCLQNTPDRVAWYTSTVPGLGFIDPDQSIMVEYGHLHGDADTGVFRSRMTLDELDKAAAERAGDGGHTLDLYEEREKHENFRELYSPLVDPFLQEARIHVLWRDRYMRRASKTDDAAEKAQYLASAYRENLVLQRHFVTLLRGSSFEWSTEEEADVKNGADFSHPHKSEVSLHLVVRFDSRQLGYMCLFGVGVLLLVAYGSRRFSGQTDAS